MGQVHLEEVGSARSRTMTITGIVLVAIAVAVAPAFASDPNSLSGSNFEIDTDANLVVDHGSPSYDWQTAGLEFVDGSSDPEDPNNVWKLDEPSGQNDDAFGQGSKEDTAVPSPVTGSIPPNKSDLKAFGLASESNASGDFIHLFWTRVQDPSGTTNMDFEFNQSDVLSPNGVTPVRTAGDLLVVYELSKGGTVPELYLFTWLDGTEGIDCEASNSYPCWGDRTDLDSASLATGSINNSTISSANSLTVANAGSNLGPQDPRTFGEASIALSALLGSSGTSCTTFGSVYLKSRSSDSFTSALKDYIAPLDTNISNCGTVVVKKVTDPASDPTDFAFTTQLTVGGASDDPSFSLDTDTSDGDSVVSTETINNVIAGSGYTVTESVPSSGWDLTSAVCTIPDGSGGTMNVSTKSGSTVTFAVTVDETVTCTFTNTKRGNVIVNKVTDPASDPTDFGFTTSIVVADGPNDPSFSLDTDADATLSNTITIDEVTPGDDYTVTESVPSSGWDLTSAACTIPDGSGGTTNVSTKSGAELTFDVNAGETVTCTFTNTKRGNVIVNKVTDPASDPTDFGFTTSIVVADGPNDPSFSLDTDADATLSNTITIDEVTPGDDYTVTESVPSSGWDLTSAACTIPDGSGGTTNVSTKSGAELTFDVNAGDTVTCTFTNTARGSIKVVKKDDVGNLLEGVEFSLYEEDGTDDSTFDDTVDTDTGSDCTTDSSGECSFTELKAGTYWVVEDAAPTGYDGADPAKAVVGAGGAVTVNVENPRLHKAILLVCHTGTDTLAPSDWDEGDSIVAPSLTTIGATELGTLATALSVESAELEAALCGLAGFDELEHGLAEFVVDVGSDAHTPN